MPPDIATQPLTPEQQDALANDALYQEFVKREGVASDETPEQAPDQAPDSTPSPDQEPSQTPEEGPQTAPEDQPAPSPTTEEPEPSELDTEEEEEAPAPDSTPQSFTVLDRTWNEDEAKSVLQVVDWFGSLPDEAVQAIDGLLSGDYVLVPRSEEGYQAPPEPDDDSDLNDLDPRVAQRLAQIERQQQLLLSQQQQEVNQQTVAAIQSGTQEFQASYELSDDEVTRLQQRVVQLQILPGYAAQYRGNPAKAMSSAMESVYWSDPTWRQREMDRQLSAAQDEEKVVKTRQRKAAAVTSGGGSVPRGEPKPMTQDDRRKAMAKEIEESMNGGQRA